MESKKHRSIDGVVVTTGVMASLLGVSDRRIRQMVEEGIIPRKANGAFELVPVVKQYILYLKTKNDTARDRDEPEVLRAREQARLEKAKRETAELKLAIMRGQYHRADAVKTVMTAMLGTFKGRIRSLPVKIAAQIRPGMGMAETAGLIGREIDECLLELSDYDPGAFSPDEIEGEEGEDES
jgi:phage terminase Nu1 subunit (DNA packaging protein)